MANIFGIEFNTADEIRAARNQRYEDLKAQVANNPNALAQIGAQQALSNMLPNAMESRANALESTIGGILSQNKKMETEDDLDYQTRIAEQIRDSVAKIDPQVALAANEKIGRIKTAKLEQAKLKTQMEAERQALEEDVYDFKLRKSPVIYGITRDGVKQALKRLRPDASLEEVRAERRAVEEQYGGIYAAFDEGTGVDMYTLDDPDFDSVAGAGALNKSSVREINEAITTNKVYFKAAGDLVDNLMETPFGAVGFGTGNVGAEVAAKIDTAIQTGKEVMKRWVLNNGGDPELAERQYEQQVRDWDSHLDRVVPQTTYGNQTSVIKSKIKALAYQLAKTLDPGGRLSDQDVQMATEMIIGTGDPDVIRQLMEARASRVHESVEADLERVLTNESGMFLTADRNEAQKYVEAKELLTQKLVRLAAKLADERGAAEVMRAKAAGDDEALQKAKAERIRRALIRRRRSGG